MGKGSDKFQERIKKYLDDLAEKDDAFAFDYERPEKSIEQCCDFIIEQVQKSGRCGFDDDEIFGLAIHYYQENDLGDIKKIDCSIVIDEQVKLTDEEIEEAKKRALERVEQEEVNRIKEEEKKAREKAQKKAEEKKAQEEAVGMMSLFDMAEL